MCINVYMGGSKISFVECVIYCRIHLTTKAVGSFSILYESLTLLLDIGDGDTIEYVERDFDPQFKLD